MNNLLDGLSSLKLYQTLYVHLSAEITDVENDDGTTQKRNPNSKWYDMAKRIFYWRLNFTWQRVMWKCSLLPFCSSHFSPLFRPMLFSNASVKLKLVMKVGKRPPKDRTEILDGFFNFWNIILKLKNTCDIQKRLHKLSWNFVCFNCWMSLYVALVSLLWQVQPNPSNSKLIVQGGDQRDLQRLQQKNTMCTHLSQSIV